MSLRTLALPLPLQSIKGNFAVGSRAFGVKRAMTMEPQWSMLAGGESNYTRDQVKHVFPYKILALHHHRRPISIQVRLQADNALSKSIRQMRVEVNLDECRGSIC